MEADTSSNAFLTISHKFQSVIADLHECTNIQEILNAINTENQNNLILEISRYCFDIAHANIAGYMFVKFVFDTLHNNTQNFTALLKNKCIYAERFRVNNMTDEMFKSMTALEMEHEIL